MILIFFKEPESSVISANRNSERKEEEAGKPTDARWEILASSPYKNLPNRCEEMCRWKVTQIKPRS